MSTVRNKIFNAKKVYDSHNRELNDKKLKNPEIMNKHTTVK
jgi:hypothetical protein